jgi:CBS-domain-containing membrane protein
MESLLVRDWMSKDPVTIEPQTTLPAAYHLMKLNRIRRLPVVDHEGRLLGIVTQGDIREARPKESISLSIWELHFRVASLEAKDFMTPNPVTVTPETSIKQAAQLMLQHKIGGLPVVEAKRLVGVITESDIFRLLVEQLPDQ